MGKDSTNENIKNGQGLSPLPSSQSPKKSGNTTEQRGQYPGIRLDNFSKKDDKDDKKEGK